MQMMTNSEAIEKCKAEFLNPNVQRETETQTLAAQSFARGWNACNRHWMSELSQLPSKVVAEIKVDTDEIMERLEQEWYKPNEWIPCSERLPEKEDVYLVTIQVKSGELYILTALWSCPLMPEFINNQARWCCPPELDDFDMDDIFHVIAWMPLPEPYKDGDNDDN